MHVLLKVAYVFGSVGLEVVKHWNWCSWNEEEVVLVDLLDPKEPEDD